jgi:hypothetical protein
VPDQHLPHVATAGGRDRAPAQLGRPELQASRRAAIRNGHDLTSRLDR